MMDMATLVRWFNNNPTADLAVDLIDEAAWQGRSLYLEVHGSTVERWSFCRHGGKAALDPHALVAAVRVERDRRDGGWETVRVALGPSLI